MKIIKRILLVTIILYVILCGGMYFFQEKLLFNPTVLNKEFAFSFDRKHEELNIPVDTDISLNALYFKADTSDGVILYCHGNSGSVNGYGDYAEIYNEMNQDYFVFDYRGFGKSDGNIHSQENFFQDAQKMYDFLKTKFTEDKITIIGYSMGTSIASYLSANNSPKQTILLAPFYSMLDMMSRRYSYVPSFLLKYPLKSYYFVEKSKSPVFIFHGKNDETVPFDSGVKFKKHLQAKDAFYSLENQDHNGIDKNENYLKNVKKWF
jgi:uncharacterized protein